MPIHNQGWPAIRNALKTRLDALSLLGPIHPTLRMIRESAPHANFQTAFCLNGAINTWLIDRNTGPLDVISDDDSRYIIRRHDIELHGYLRFLDTPPAVTSFDAWNAILEQIVTDLRTGDRTLGNTCLVYSLPRIISNGIAPFSSMDCHGAVIAITAEEVIAP